MGNKEIKKLKEAFEKYKEKGFCPVPCYLNTKIVNGKKKKEVIIVDWRSKKSFEFGDLMRERSQLPNAIALRTGEEFGIIGVDVDVHDANGFDEIKNLDYKNQYCTKTQSGGIHILFKDCPELRKRVLKANPARTSLTTAKTKKGIDIRDNGGLLFTAPSMVEGGGVYEHFGSDTVNEMTIEFQNFVFDLLRPTVNFSNAIVPNSLSYDWYGCLAFYEERYSVGDRSSLDFYITKRAIEFEKSENELKHVLYNVPNSKIAEKKEHQQEAYFNVTYQKAKIFVENKIGRVIEITNSDGIIEERPIFWEVKEKELSNGNVSYSLKISNSKLINVLTELGFYKTKYDGRFIYIYEPERTIIKITDIEEIRNELSQLVRCLPEIVDQRGDGAFEVRKDNILDLIVDYTKIDKAIFELPMKKISFMKDTKEKVCFPFRNGLLNITKDNYYLEPYSDCKHKIWFSRVINRDFHFEDFDKFDFNLFIKNLANNDDKRETAFKCAIGYLCSNFKNPAMAKLIYLIDENLTEGEANGRTGKSLIGKAIEHVASLKRFDGRTFTFRDNHALSPVTLETQVVDFNDMKERFDYGKLFSLITDSWNIRPLYESSKIIHFKDSPKILVSSNYTMGGTGTSFKDRIYTLEVSDHYSVFHKPTDDFRKLFFLEWSNEDWSMFYSFILVCVQKFLNDGLPSVESRNEKERDLYSAVPYEFIEFMKEKSENMELFGKWISKKDLQTDFYMIFGTDKANHKTFQTYLRRYCKLKEIEMQEATSKNVLHYKYFNGKPRYDVTSGDYVRIKSRVSCVKFTEIIQDEIDIEESPI